MDFINAFVVLTNFTIIPALAYGSQLALGAIFVTLISAFLPLVAKSIISCLTLPLPFMALLTSLL